MDTMEKCLSSGNHHLFRLAVDLFGPILRVKSVTRLDSVLMVVAEHPEKSDINYFRTIQRSVKSKRSLENHKSKPKSPLHFDFNE